MFSWCCFVSQNLIFRIAYGSNIGNITCLCGVGGREKVSQANPQMRKALINYLFPGGNYFWLGPVHTEGSGEFFVEENIYLHIVC